jgi:hypothetical protein
MLKPPDMKLYHALFLVSGIVFVQGCVSSRNHLVLDAVGPAPGANHLAGPKGVLMVYSAFDQLAHFSGSIYRRYHTDYKIMSEDGKVLQNVRNDAGGVMEDPRPVELQVGRYRIVARANGYGWVTVPVLVVAHEVTIVHLEGGSAWANDKPLASNSVQLPDGRIAGWRAEQ